MPGETGALPRTIVLSDDTVAVTAPMPANWTVTVPPPGPRFVPPIVNCSAPVALKFVGVIVCGIGGPVGPPGPL